MSRKFKLVNGVLAIFGVFGMVVVILMLSGAISTNDRKNQAADGLNIQAGKFTSVALPDEMNFAGEKIPLENFDVKESLEKEMLVNTYWQSQTFLLIKRANRFFPIIEPILKRQGVPDDFKFLAVAESGLANVVSPAGAAGPWQFVKQTGTENGLEINDEVDERYSVEKSTEAACRFLKHSYDIYKSWTMVAASYNMGRTGLNNQIANQYTKNYYDILLNEETSRYVFRIAALKAIINNPGAYGFSIKGEDLYKPYQCEELVISSRISDIAQFAFQHETNYKMLKLLNPWMRKNTLTNSNKKAYTVKIPLKGSRNVAYTADKGEIDSILARTAREEKDEQK